MPQTDRDGNPGAQGPPPQAATPGDGIGPLADRKEDPGALGPPSQESPSQADPRAGAGAVGPGPDGSADT
jgi:hypothetical protein